MEEETSVLRRAPTPQKKGTPIRKWKYDLIRNANLEAVPQDAVAVLLKTSRDWVTSNSPKDIYSIWDRPVGIRRR